MKNTIPFVFLIVCSVQSAFGWERVSPEGLGFSVSMPTKPKSQPSPPAIAADKSTEQHTLVSSTANEVFVVVATTNMAMSRPWDPSVDVPEPIRKQQLDQLAAMGLEVVSKGEIDGADETQGFEVVGRGKAPDGTEVRMTQRAFISGRTCYVFGHVIQEPVSESNLANEKLFFDSVELLADPVAAR